MHGLKKTKRGLALLLAVLMLLMVAAVPPGALAADETPESPDWGETLIDLLEAGALGAVDGFIQSASVAGAIAGGARETIAAAAGKDPAPSETLSLSFTKVEWAALGEDDEDQGPGPHHNRALTRVYGSDLGGLLFPEPLFPVELTDRLWAQIDGLILEELKERGLVDNGGTIDITILNTPPAAGASLERIVRSVSGPVETERRVPAPVVSERFVDNLQTTLEILRRDVDNPQQALDEAIVYFLNASLRETDGDFLDDFTPKAQDYNSTRSNKRENSVDLGPTDDSPFHIDRIDGTYTDFIGDGKPVDIVLAAVFVDVLQSSAQYWTDDLYCWGQGADSRAQETDGNGLYCWGVNFARIDLHPDLDRDELFVTVGDYPWPDFLDVDDDGDGIPTRLELVIDRTTARSGERDVELDVAPYITDGRTMVPFRFIGEQLGARVAWVSETRTVTYRLETDKGTVTIDMPIGQNSALVDGRPVPVDPNPGVVPVIVNGRTFVPLRFIGETLGFQVDWDGATRQVTISN